MAVYDDSPLPQLPAPPAGRASPAAPQPLAAPPCSDCDGDGHPGPRDCNDSNALVHPGAVDVLANALDEDCDGPASYALLASAITYAVRVSRAGTTFTSLSVRPVAAATTIRVSCRGRGCALHTKTLVVTKQTPARDLLPLLKRRRLHPGARLEIRLTKPGTIGIVRRLRIRTRKPPQRTDKCLAPSASAFTACPR